MARGSGVASAQQAVCRVEISWGNSGERRKTATPGATGAESETACGTTRSTPGRTVPPRSTHVSLPQPPPQRRPPDAQALRGFRAIPVAVLEDRLHLAFPERVPGIGGDLRGRVEAAPQDRRHRTLGDVARGCQAERLLQHVSE